MKSGLTLLALALNGGVRAEDAEEPAAVEAYAPAVPTEGAYFASTFQSGAESMWVASADAKYAGQKVSVGQGSLGAAFEGDTALVLEEEAHHYGVSAAFTEPTSPDADAFVVQYEVRLHKGLTCGGAYVKLV